MQIKKLRLTLCRETLSLIGDETLVRVEGGLKSGDPQPLSSGPSWCGGGCR